MIVVGVSIAGQGMATVITYRRRIQSEYDEMAAWEDENSSYGGQAVDPPPPSRGVVGRKQSPPNPNPMGRSRRITERSTWGFGGFGNNMGYLKWE